MPDYRFPWKQFLKTIGFYRETVVDHGTTSGTVTVAVSDGVNHKMTLSNTSTINIVITGEPSNTMTHVLLNITMSSAYAVTWQLNGVTQSGVSISLNASGQTEVLIRSWDNWATYVATRAR